MGYLDIRGIVFTDGEANRLLATERLDVGQLLDDQRWFHGLDKAANGRVLYDSDGSTGSLLARITKLRWSDPVVAERKVRRQNRVPQPSLADLETVRRKIIDGTTTEGNLAFRNLVGGLVWSLFSVRWDDSGKLGRNCTRFEVEAARRGLGEPARKLIRLVESPADSPARLRRAPNRVVDQHRLSYPARILAGEDVTKEEDARDVLDFFTNLMMSEKRDRFPAWTGLTASRSTLQRRFDKLGSVIESLPLEL